MGLVQRALDHTRLIKLRHDDWRTNVAACAWQGGKRLTEPPTVIIWLTLYETRQSEEYIRAIEKGSVE